MASELSHVPYHRHAEALREKERHRSNFLGLKEKNAERVEEAIATGELFLGSVLGGVMQGQSADPKGPHLFGIPMELLVGGGLVALGMADVVGSASWHLTEIGKGVAISWGTDWGHSIGERKKLTGSYFGHHSGSPALPHTAGAPSPQAMADALLAQAQGR